MGVQAIRAGYESAVEFFGGIPELAAALDVTRQAIYLWDGIVPKSRVFEIELLTDGKLRRHQLRPDLYPQETEVDLAIFGGR